MRFRRELARLERSLEVPYPERRELLEEMAGHLEALYEEARASGASEAEAEARALAAMAIDGDFAAAIDEVHRPAVARALARLPRRLSVGLELGAVTALAVGLNAFVLTREASMGDFIADGGLFMYPLLAAGVAIVALTLERLWSLLVKRDHAETNLGRRRASLRFLGVASLLVGVIGTLVGLYEAFGVAARPGVELPVLEVLRIAMSTTIVGAVLALLAVSAGYVVAGLDERVRRQRLGEG